MRDRLIRLCTSLPLFDEFFYALVALLSKSGHQSAHKFKFETEETGQPDLYDVVVAIAAPRNSSSELWGDLHFAKEISLSLNKINKSSKVLFRGDSKTQNNGKVFLHIRGLLPTKPPKNSLNILWIISHPDQVSKREMSKYDLVFAASEYWATKMSRKTGINIQVLLQASNPETFKISSSNTHRRTGIVFVGNTKSRRRKIVHDVISQGYAVEVYGGGWEKLIDDKFIFAESVSNEELPQIYQKAKVVLNDQWNDMSINGFVSNRIIDAINCGAFCLTEDIKNTSLENFPNLRSYKNLEELNLHLDELLHNELSFEDIKYFSNEFSFDSRIKEIIVQINSIGA